MHLYLPAGCGRLSSIALYYTLDTSFFAPVRSWCASSSTSVAAILEESTEPSTPLVFPKCTNWDRSELMHCKLTAYAWWLTTVYKQEFCIVVKSLTHTLVPISAIARSNISDTSYIQHGNGKGGPHNIRSTRKLQPIPPPYWLVIRCLWWIFWRIYIMF